MSTTPFRLTLTGVLIALSTSTAGAEPLSAHAFDTHRVEAEKPQQKPRDNRKHSHIHGHTQANMTSEIQRLANIQNRMHRPGTPSMTSETGESNTFQRHPFHIPVPLPESYAFETLSQSPEDNHRQENRWTQDERNPSTFVESQRDRSWSDTPHDRIREQPLLDREDNKVEELWSEWSNQDGGGVGFFSNPYRGGWHHNERAENLHNFFRPQTPHGLSGTGGNNAFSNHMENNAHTMEQETLFVLGEDGQHWRIPLEHGEHCAFMGRQITAQSQGGVQTFCVVTRTR